MLTARDVMTEQPATITTEATLREAVRILELLDIRHLPVVNDEGELVGMISDRDLRALSIPHFIGGEHVGSLRTALDSRVASIMSSDVLAVDTEASAASVVDLMLENKVGAIPVTAEDGELVGIVSYADVLRALPFDEAD